MSDPGEHVVPETTCPPPRSVLAILSLAFGVIGFVSIAAAGIAILTGHLARHRARTIAPHERGQVLAKWGLALGYAGLVVQLTFWILVIAGVLEPSDVFHFGAFFPPS